MKQGWERIPFEDSIDKVKYTSKIASGDYLEQGLYPIVSQEEGLISGYWNDAKDLFKISKPVVIFGDHTRILKYVDFDFVLGADGVKILQPIDGINAKFLKYYLDACKIPSLGYSRHYKLLKDLQVPVPPLPEQEKIVSELDCLSGILDKKRQQLKELDALAQSIFYEMFGDPVTNERGWEVKKWYELFDTILGKMLDKKKQIETDEALPYLGNTNVQWGYFDLQDLKTMTFSNKEREKFRLTPGDILICEGGDAGRCAVWSGSSDEILFQKAIHRARRKKEDEIVPCYISFLLREIKANGGLKNYISKSTIEHLTGEKLNMLAIILPPLPLQQTFATKIEAIESQKALIKQSIAETETLQNSRMDYYFN